MWYARPRFEDPTEEIHHAQSAHRQPRPGRRADRRGNRDRPLHRSCRGSGRSPAARRTSSACSTPTPRRSRSAPTTRPTRPGSAATRRRSRGRSATRTAARGTSPPSPTRSRSSSASRRQQVKWTVTPFNNSFRPGKKAFDFYITQVSYNPQRAKAVDFSKGYYFVNQSIVGTQGHADRIGALDQRAQEVHSSAPRSARRATTTSSSRSSRARRRRSTTRTTPAVQALKNGQIDGLVVDLPTAFYVTAVQVPDGKVDRPVRRPGLEGALRARPAEGQQADRLRQQGARPAVGERDDQEPPAHLARQGNRRARPEVVR